MFARHFQILLLGVVMAIFTQTGFAQTIDWGEDIETNKNIGKIIGETEDGHYALAYRSNFWYVEKYEGKEMKLAFSTKLDLPDMNDRRTRLGNVYYMEDQLVLFTWQYDKKSRKYYVYGYLLNEKGEIPDEHVEVLAADVENRSRSGDFFIKLSRDRSKMLLIHSAPHKRTEEDKWVINIRVLTPSLFVIKEMEETYPWVRRSKTNERYTISSAAISNEGGAYMAVRKREWDRRAKLYVTKEMNVYMYDPANGFEVRKIPVDLGDKSASSILLDIDREGNLVGGGFYGERTPRGLFKYEGIKGSYYLKINRVTEEVETVTTEDFDDDFTSKILKEKQVDKGKLVPNYFIPRKIILKEGGGAIMIAEYYLLVITETRTGTTEQYHHGPVVVVSVDAEGNQEWVRAVPKNQYFARNQGLFGFFGFFLPGP
jgi:hypothetical protein